MPKKKVEFPASFIPAANARNYPVIESQPISIPEIKVVDKIEIDLNSELEPLKVKLFKLTANYNICLERDKLLHQRISELLEDINYYKDQIKQLEPDWLMEALAEEPEAT